MTDHMHDDAQTVGMPTEAQLREAIADGWSLGNSLYDDFDEMMRLRFDAAARAVIALGAQPPAAPVETDEGKEWIVPHENCLNCSCSKEERCAGWKEHKRSSAGTGSDEPSHVMCIGWPTIKRLAAGESVWFESLQCGAVAADDLHGADIDHMLALPQTLWQSMDSAPKDGTKVDLLYPYPRGRTIDCMWRQGGVDGDGRWIWLRPVWGSQPGLGIEWHLLPESEWEVCSYPNMEPTHWMPSCSLPRPKGK